VWGPRRDQESGRRLEIPALGVVNATGVHSDVLRGMDDPALPPIISASQGTHLGAAAGLPPREQRGHWSQDEDGRVLFAVPWQRARDRGDHRYRGRQDRRGTAPMAEEVEFLLTHAARYLTRDPQPSDVLSVFSGLRPLVARAAQGHGGAVPGPHHLCLGLRPAHRGGREVDHLPQDGGDVVGPGGDARGPGASPVHLRAPASPRLDPPGFPRSPILVIYGADAPRVMELGRQDRSLWERLSPDLPYLARKVVWAARHEMARSVTDVLARRTRALLLGARAPGGGPGRSLAPGAELHRDAAWETRSTASSGTWRPYSAD